MSVSAAHLGGGEQQQAAAVEPPQKRGVTGYILLLPGALWLAIFFLVPTITLVSTSLYDPAGSVETGYSMTWHWQNYVDGIRDYGVQFGRSLVYALLATLACILLGYPLAYAIAFKSGRWKNLMLVLVIAPFFTSFLVRTLSWQLLLGDNGFLVETLKSLQLLGTPTTRMIGNEIQDLFGAGAYPVAAALSVTLMTVIVAMVFLYVRRAGTEELV